MTKKEKLTNSQFFELKKKTNNQKFKLDPV